MSHTLGDALAHFGLYRRLRGGHWERRCYGPQGEVVRWERLDGCWGTIRRPWQHPDSPVVCEEYGPR